MLKNYFKIAIAVLKRNKFFTFISLFGIACTLILKPEIKIDFAKGKYITNPTQNIHLVEFIDVKGWRALGNKLSNDKISNIQLIAAKKEEKEAAKELPAKTKEEKKGIPTGSTVELDVKKKN